MGWMDEEKGVKLTRRQIRFLIMMLHVMRATDQLKGVSTDIMEIINATEKALSPHAD